jgi:hypothetical protein
MKPKIIARSAQGVNGTGELVSIYKFYDDPTWPCGKLVVQQVHDLRISGGETSLSGKWRMDVDCHRFLEIMGNDMHAGRLKFIKAC